MPLTPSPPDESIPKTSADPAEDELAKKSQDAAMQRYAEVSLKSVPLPEGYDEKKRASIGEAFRTIRAGDFLRAHQAPCSREGFLSGILSGATIGAVRYIAGGPIPKSTNWAVGSGLAISLLAYEYCQYQRRLERANMKRVVEVVSKKRLEMAKEQEQEKRRLEQQEQQQSIDEAVWRENRKWYAFW